MFYSQKFGGGWAKVWLSILENKALKFIAKKIIF
jgi:hypothetical protein